MPSINLRFYFFLCFTFLVVSFSLFLAYIKTRDDLSQTPKEADTKPTPTIKPIDKMITCPQNVFAQNEITYRTEALTTPLRITKMYTETYEKKWSLNDINEQYNVIVDNSDLYNKNIDKDAGKYPNTKIEGENIYLPFPVNISNYIEEVVFRPYELEVSGEGIALGERNNLYAHSSASFSENGRDCFDSGRRQVYFYLSYFVDKKYSASWDVIPRYNFSVFTPQYCKVYDFIESSQDIFVSCLSQKVSREQIKYLVMGFHLDKNEKEPAESTLKPIFTDYVTENITEEMSSMFEPNNYEFIKTDNKYLLISPTKIIVLKINSEGFLAKSKEILLGDFNTRYDPTSYTSEVLNGRYLFMRSLKEPIVFDTLAETFLAVSDQCYLALPEENYNDYLDPFNEGPYKSLKLSNLTPESFVLEQISDNAGCSTLEGTIKVVVSKNQVSCKNNLINKQTCF